jgi:acetyltransferase-like isoleucine patch superfamily enzyme
MFIRILQIIAFFFPSPINVWLHRLAGAKIDRHVFIYPAVLILAKNVEIGREAQIKLGTMINARTFKLGKKSRIGFFTFVKGESDLLVGDACIIGPKCMINCSRPVVLDYYSGVGPGSYLYTHGSGMPVTEGYRATFAPIHIKEKAWVNMHSTIGPGVTIGEGSIIMPGTILLESVGPKRMVTGDPAKLNNLPIFFTPIHDNSIKELSEKILKEFCNWSNEYEKTSWTYQNSTLRINHNNRNMSVAIDGPGDIILLTEAGDKSEKMYFNLADLSTDESRDPMKLKLEAFMRLYFGLIFL